MKIKFKDPILPNYIKTNKGSFALSYFEEEEIDEFISLYSKQLKYKWKKLNFERNL